MPSYYLRPLPVQPRNQPAARPVYHSPPGGSVVICKPISQQHRVYRYICQANGPRLRLSPLSLPLKRINVFLTGVVAVTLPLVHVKASLTDLLIVSPRANTDNGAVSNAAAVLIHSLAGHSINHSILFLLISVWQEIRPRCCSARITRFRINCNGNKKRGRD